MPREYTQNTHKSWVLTPLSYIPGCQTVVPDGIPRIVMCDCVGTCDVQRVVCWAPAVLICVYNCVITLSKNKSSRDSVCSRLGFRDFSNARIYFFIIVFQVQLHISNSCRADKSRPKLIRFCEIVRYAVIVSWSQNPCRHSVPAFGDMNSTHGQWWVTPPLG